MPIKRFYWQQKDFLSFFIYVCVCVYKRDVIENAQAYFASLL